MKNPIKRKGRRVPPGWSKGQRVFHVFNCILMALIILLTILPLLNALAVSFSSDLTSLEPGLKLLPSEWSLDGYRRLFEQVRIGKPLMNSVYTTLVGTVLHVLFCAITAYALTGKDYSGKKAFLVILLITYAVPLQNIMIPTFILYRDMHLLNTFIPIIISGMVTAYAVTLLKSFFEQVPEALREAAIVDGAGSLTIFFKIYLPLAMPGIATIALYRLVGKWNILLEPALFITDPKKNTLQVALKSLVITSDAASSASFMPKNTIMAGVIISILPLLILYPVLQRFFIGQLMSGSMKE